MPGELQRKSTEPYPRADGPRSRRRGQHASVWLGENPEYRSATAAPGAATAANQNEFPANQNSRRPFPASHALAAVHAVNSCNAGSRLEDTSNRSRFQPMARDVRANPAAAIQSDSALAIALSRNGRLRPQTRTARVHPASEYAYPSARLHANTKRRACVEPHPQ